jgi:hypothetical protein
MVAVPLVTPVTTPDAELTDAIVVLLLLHAPPGVASERVVVEPAQIEVEPVMDKGPGFTVAVVVT